ncbi:DNA repair protein RadC [Vibrio parahaemolyticus]|nr:DNA repair protein RadC [Vibrio parahaemolyticus]
MNQKYTFHQPVTAYQILEKAAEILEQQYLRGDALCSPQATRDYLKYRLGAKEREVFSVLLLDNQNRVIAYEELFQGTIDSASVYPREVVKTALKANASAVIFAHNHPSGVTTPSEADKRITKRLQDALSLIDIRVLDHFIIGQDTFSFAERGLI